MERATYGEDGTRKPFVSGCSSTIPGAWWSPRSALAQALKIIPSASRYVLTCGSSLLARFAAQDLAALTDRPVWVLDGGNAAWFASGLPQESGDARLASPRIDRYRRPKAPTTPRRRCRPTSTGSSGWWPSWGGTARTSSK